MTGPGLPAVQHRHAKAYFDVALRTGTRAPHCGLYGGTGGMRDVEGMLARDVSPLAKQDLDVGRCEIEWPE